MYLGVELVNEFENQDPENLLDCMRLGIASIVHKSPGGILSKLMRHLHSKDEVLLYYIILCG